MVRIFVEGKEDRQFIEYTIEHFHSEQNAYEIIAIDGYTKIDISKNQFKENTDAGGINLVIFDADEEYNNGGG